MAFIIFPVFVLIMVFVVVISYKRMNGIRKKLHATGQRIQLLHQQEVVAINNALFSSTHTGPIYPRNLESLREILRIIQDEPAKNVNRSLYYHQLLQSAIRKMSSNPEAIQGSAEEGVFNKYDPELKQLTADIKIFVEHYNASAAQFNNSLRKFPNNLLAAMAGLSPYEQLSA